MTQKKKGVFLISGLARKDIYRQFKSLNKRQQAEFINSLVDRSPTYITGHSRDRNIRYKYHLPVNGKQIRTTRQTMLEILKIDVPTLKNLQESVQMQSSEVSSTMKIANDFDLDRSLTKYSAKNNIPIVDLSPRVNLKKIPDSITSTMNVMCDFATSPMDATFVTPRAARIRSKPYETPRKNFRSPNPKNVPYWLSQCDNYSIYETPKKKKSWIRTDPVTNADLKLSVDSWTQTKPSVVVHPTEKQKNFVEQGVQTDPPNGDEKLKITFQFREKLMTSINMKRIEANPQTFIGVPSLDWLDNFSVHYTFNRNHILLVLLKVRHNDTLARLASDFDKSEREMLKLLHDNIPLTYTILSHVVDWESFIEDDEGVPDDLKVKFANLKSILRIIHVRIGENFQHLKFFISILPTGQISFVSEPVAAKESNEKMVRRSNFMNEAPKNCAIIVEEELVDVAEMLIERGFTVYAKESLQEEDYSCNVFLQRDIEFFCNKVNPTVTKVMEFKVMQHFVISEFEDLKGFHLVANIVAAMVNLQIYNEKNLELQKQD